MTRRDATQPQNTPKVVRSPFQTETDLLRALDQLGRTMAGELDLGHLARLTTGVIKESLGLAYVSLIRIDHDRQIAEYLGHTSDFEPTVKMGDTQPLSCGLVGLCAREGRTILIEDVRTDPHYVEIIPGVVTELVVPILSRGRTIAVLNCESREPGGLRGRAMFLEVAANRVGAALENALLLLERGENVERLRRHARQMELLNEIARIATQDLELRPMLQRVTDTLSAAFDWEFVACATVDADRGRFVCLAVTSRVQTAVHVGYGRELGSGVVGEVAQSGRALLIDDTRTHANYVETLPGALSELCVPVKSAGRVVALLNLESTRIAAFHDQLPLLETVAEQIAGAIAGAHLFTHVRHRAQQLAMVSELSRAAMTATDLQPLLDRVVDYVHRRMGLPLVAIVLLDEKGAELELVAHAGAVPLSVSRGARWPAHKGVVGRAVRLGEPQFVPDVRSDPDYVLISPEVAAELAIPIRFEDRTLGVMNVEAMSADALSPEVVLVLRTFVDQVAGAIHMAAVNRRLAEANRALTALLSRYVAPDVAQQLLVDPERFHSRGERRDATVLLAELPGFAALCDTLDAERAVALLNDFHAAVSGAVFEQRGSIHRFIGDGFMAVFGVPERIPNHVTAAAQAAKEIARRAEALSERWAEAVGGPLRVVVAAHTGEALTGSIGGPHHREFAIVGDVVQLATRLPEQAVARGARVLVTEAVAKALPPQFQLRPVGAADLGAAGRSVHLYQLM